MRVRLLAVACVVPLVAGCGTMANMAGKDLPLIADAGRYEPRPFGGVRNDVRWTCTGVGNYVFGIIDLPFSFIGDVVTLPKILLTKPTTKPEPSHAPVAEETASGSPKE